LDNEKLLSEYVDYWNYSYPIAKRKEILTGFKDKARLEGRKLYEKIFEGLLLLEKGEYEDAAKEFNSIIEEDDTCFLAWRGLAKANYLLKDCNQAVAPLKKALEIQPDFFPTLCLSACLKVEMEDISGAYNEAKKALELDIEKKSVPCRIILGRILSIQGKYNKAEHYYKEALLINSQSAQAFNALGNLYLHLKKYNQAKDNYFKAINCDKDFANPWNGLGSLYCQLRNYEKAEDFYIKASNLDPNYITPWLNLAEMYTDLNRIEDAIYCFQKLNSIKFNPDYLTKIGSSYLGLRRYKEAKDYLFKALESFQETDNFRASIAESIIKEAEFLELMEKEENRDEDDKLRKILIETREIEEKSEKNKESFLKFIGPQDIKDFYREKPEEKNAEAYLEVLRKWNSYTPIIADDYQVSKGGGYFLKINNRGIVIDPGFNYIHNFKAAGYKFYEIDDVFISHAHNDHTADLESILTLVYKYNEELKGMENYSNFNTIRAELARKHNKKIHSITRQEIEQEFKISPRQKKINLYMTSSVFKKYAGLFDLCSHAYYNVYFLERDSVIPIGTKSRVKVLRAKHFDTISDVKSCGFLIEYYDKAIIYTGDTGWDSDAIIQQYNNIKNYKYKLLIAHIGGFKEYEWNYIRRQGDKTYYTNHLGRLGLVELNQALQPNVCLISEFGEEFKDFRRKIAGAFSEVFKNDKITYIPADIGLKFDLRFEKIKAITDIDPDKYAFSEDYIEPSEVKVGELRKFFSLFYFCKNDKFSESDLVQVLLDRASGQRFIKQP